MTSPSGVGQAAQVFYEDGRFIVRAGEHEQEQTIERDCIIGILTVQEDAVTHYTLLYTKVAGEPADAKIEQRTTFQALPIQGPSEKLLHDFSPNQSSLWRHDPKLDSESAKLYVIISTGSGAQHAQTCFDNLLQPFLMEIGLAPTTDYTVFHSESAETIINLAKSTFLPNAQQGIPQSIVLLSGDGGLVDLINGLLYSPATPTTYKAPHIALLPTGTANALAHSTGTTSDRTLGLSTLYRGHPRPLPIFKATLSPGSTLLDSLAAPIPSTSPLHPASPTASPTNPITVYGAVVFSYGLHASLVADSDTPSYRRHGPARFALAARDLLFPSSPPGASPHAYRARVSLRRPGGGGEWHVIPREDHAYVLATLVARLEERFLISPASRALDGRLRVVEFGPMEGGGKDVMGVMEKAYAGGVHVEDRRVGYEEVDGVRVQFGEEGEEERWRRVCVDGKIFVVGEGGWAMVEREERRCVELIFLER